MSLTQSQELEDLYDAKINAHFAKISLLREQRNADCSKTKKLPAEILSMIFANLHCFRSFTERSPYQKWIAVTHVCRTWRNSALNDPTLWSDFTVVPHNWITEAFARSKTAPLRLQYGSYRKQSDERLAFLFDHVVEHPERIKHLRVHEVDVRPLIDRLTKPAPFLEHLSIIADTELPSDFLGGVAPRLRSFSHEGTVPLEASWLANLTKLACGKVHLEAPYMSNLISLELGSTWAPLDATGRVIRRMSIDVLLSALENMPLLQELYLVLSDLIGDTPSSRSVPVHLHHLRDITTDFFRRPQKANLFNHLRMDSNLFNHLRVDSIERLHTIWHFSSEDIAVVEPVCRFFEACYRGGDLEYLLETSLGMEIDQLPPPIARRSPVLRFDCYPTTVAGIVNLLPHYVPRILAAHHSTPVVRPFRLVDCDTIEELHISMSRDAVSLELPPDEGFTPYPSLRRLHLEFINFVPKAKRISQLKRWISRRKSTTKIELLVLKNCGFSEKDIASLQKVVTVAGS